MAGGFKLQFMKNKEKRVKKKKASIVVALLVLSVLMPLSLGATGTQDVSGDEPMEISWLVRLPDGEETSWFIQEVEQKLNVRIKPNGIDTNDGEKVSVMLAAGEFPDVGTTWSLMPLQGYEEGVYRPIPLSMIREHMPNYTKLIDNEYPVIWEMWLNPDNDDERLCISGIYELLGYPTWMIAFRADWARKVGVEIPNYENKIPLDNENRTFFVDGKVDLDWLENLLVAFKNGDPDGNGKNDTIPWGANSTEYWSFGALTGSFGLPLFMYAPSGNDTLPIYIHPNYKEYLKLLARWYSKGLIDNEFLNLGVEKAWDKIKFGNVGVAVVDATGAGSENQPPSLFASLDDVSSGAEVVVMPGPYGPDGIRGTNQNGHLGAAHPYYVSCVNADVDDEKLAKILEIYDFFMFGEDKDWVHGQYGKEGVHFDWEGKPWESKPIARNPEDVPAGYPTVGKFGTNYPNALLKSRIKFVLDEKTAEFLDSYLMQPEGQSLIIKNHRFDIKNETRYEELVREYGATLGPIVGEFYAKAITGEIDIDAEWDEHVKTWMDNGGAELVVELNKAPLISELLKGNLIY